MNRECHIAIIGSATLAGEAVLDLLAEKEFPIADLSLLGVGDDVGSTQFYKEKSHRVQDIAEFDFAGVDIAIFIGDAQLAEQYAETAADTGAAVIDSTGCFAEEDDIPVVVAQVNPEAIAEYGARNIISSPSSLSVAVVTVVAPLYRQLGLRSLQVSSYQSVSDYDKSGIEELAGQTAALLNSREPQSSVMQKQIAFNILSQVGELTDSGYSSVEQRFMSDIQRLFNNDYLPVSATCVQVPVFYGHAASVHLELDVPTSLWDVKDMLATVDGVDLVEDSDVISPVTDASGNETIYVSRIRTGLVNENSIDLFVLADNVRNGVALNCVQIAEYLIARHI